MARIYKEIYRPMYAAYAPCKVLLIAFNSLSIKVRLGPFTPVKTPATVEFACSTA